MLLKILTILLCIVAVLEIIYTTFMMYKANASYKRDEEIQKVLLENAKKDENKK